jgi:hypothetical protein
MSNFLCVQLDTDLENRNLLRNGFVCIKFVGSLTKLFQLVLVRLSHEPTFLRSDVG